MTLPSITDAKEYGLPKKDFDFVVDPETDFSAKEIENLAIDVAALSFTAPRAIAMVDEDGTLLSHSAMWGDTFQVQPVVTANSIGNYTITWASAYSDLNPTPDRREVHPIRFRFATAQCCDLHAVRAAPTVTWTGNSVTVEWWDLQGAPYPTKFVVFAY